MIDQFKIQIDAAPVHPCLLYYALENKARTSIKMCKIKEDELKNLEGKMEFFIMHRSIPRFISVLSSEEDKKVHKTNDTP